MKLLVYPDYHKSLDSEGGWDGTWYTSYAWTIINENGEDMQGRDGYITEQRAIEDGEKALKNLEDKL